MFFFCFDKIIVLSCLQNNLTILSLCGIYRVSQLRMKDLYPENFTETPLTFCFFCITTCELIFTLL